MAEAIREVVATAILFEVADPRVNSVTVLRVAVSGDLRQATVFVSIMGTPSEQKRAFEGLKHASGFLQARVAARLQTRFTPVLSFKLDPGVKRSVEITRLIEQAIAADQRVDLAPTDPAANAGDPDAPESSAHEESAQSAVPESS
jgi:ribosome-binding factor A